MAKKKTKEEKIRSGYRLANWRLKADEQRQKRDTEEFGYLSKDYVRKDLTKTVVISIVIVGFLLLAKRYLG